MDILGVGPLELIFILLLALIIMGPKDMVKSGRTIGRFLRKIVTSPSWYAVQKTSQEIRNLPTRLIREAGLEEMKDQLPDTAQIAKEFNLKTIGQDLSADIESEAQSSPDNNSYQDSGRDSDQNTDQISDISAWTTSPDTLETSPKSQKSE
jgi:sec-independent protein translocase protein TatB